MLSALFPVLNTLLTWSMVYCSLEQSLQYYEQRFTSAQPLSTDGAAAPSLGGPPVMSKDEERVEIARLVRALAESNMLVEQRNHDLEALQVEKDAVRLFSCSPPSFR